MYISTWSKEYWLKALGNKNPVICIAVCAPETAACLWKSEPRRLNTWHKIVCIINKYSVQNSLHFLNIIIKFMLYQYFKITDESAALI